ncbi:MAG: hypothetical protein ACKV2T_30135 [Kofleriaceae bacterium]
MRLPLLAIALAAATPVAVSAQPKTKGQPACGVTLLPLVTGNQWTYSFVPAPQPAEPAITRIAPATPKGFIITVKNIETTGPDTVVTLEEKLTYDFTKDPKKQIVEERIVTSTITCSAKKFDISPQSFFFAGEPGGYLGLVVDKVERKGTSIVLTGGRIGEAEWPEDLVIVYKKRPTEGSNATLGSGKLELERRFTPLESEDVATKSTAYPKTEKLAVKTTGRITLDKPLSKELKPMELPAEWVNILWFSPGTGLVQTQNRYAHMYQLVDSQLK